MATPVLQSIILAAGCFWGVEELIRKVPGVTETEVGYSGGSIANPTYEIVKLGNSGHAEAVKITYDPKKVSLEKILELFFQLHDPTTLNRQGNDVGTQYRSTIFTTNDDERKTAQRAIEKAQTKWPNPIKTTVDPLKQFYPAEVYHQDYLQKNPGGYTCHYWRK